MSDITLNSSAALFMDSSHNMNGQLCAIGAVEITKHVRESNCLRDALDLFFFLFFLFFNIREYPS